MQLVLLKLSEVFVYKLPKAKIISQGRRAEQWDLANPLLTGSVTVLSEGERIVVNILNRETGAVFASAPIETSEEKPLEYFLESCKDSSRYFVLRIEDEKTKRHMYVGIGFRDRQSAFDLRAALDDQVRRTERLRSLAAAPDGEKDTQTEETSASKESNEADSKPEEINKASVKSATSSLGDLSLKEGEKIKVKLKLRPKEKPIKKEVEEVAEDEWGDFQS